jgi:hypothetical protein
MSYRYNFFKELKEKSENKELYWEEWEKLDFYEDNRDCEGSCICGKKNIRYEFKITNIINGNEIYPVGSECIKKINNNYLDDSLKEIEKELKRKEAKEKLIKKMDNYILTIGKYEGKTFNYIVNYDSGYCNFIQDKAFKKEFNKFKKYLELINF